MEKIAFLQDHAEDVICAAESIVQENVLLAESSIAGQYTKDIATSRVQFCLNRRMYAILVLTEDAVKRTEHITFHIKQMPCQKDDILKQEAIFKPISKNWRK